MKINVTKTFLPAFDEYAAILKRAWEKAWITNNGELVLELEEKIRQYLGVPNFLYCSNGTITLQIALKVLGVTKEVITTPFSYVATTNAILWEGCTPVFVDIDPENFCIEADKIEKAITKDTQAILATHVYGMPCNVEKIEKIASQHKLKVIYDGAHGFGCIYKNKSLLSYGDVTSCSFHATKLFHTVEGGAIICNDSDIHKKCEIVRSFGHKDDNYFSVGVNAKNSEFHAAMGLTTLPYLSGIIERRKQIHNLYLKELDGLRLRFLNFDRETLQYNYAYFPVVFESEKKLLDVKKSLEENNINTRRYFYPSLNTLPFLRSANSCPVSEDIAVRVLCLPMFPELEDDQVKRIASLIRKTI